MKKNVGPTTVGGAHVPALDGWRGLAIACVLFAHLLALSVAHGQWLGGFGVTLFFVLSGRLMSELLFVKQVPLDTFFARRFARVLPTFLFFVGVMVVYADFFQPVTFRVPAREMAGVLLMVSSYFPSDVDVWADTWPSGHLWSLNVEEHSYVFLAVLALVCRRSGRRKTGLVLLGLSTVCIACIPYLYAVHPPEGRSAWIARTECAALALVASATLRAYLAEVPERVFRLVPPLLPVLTFVVGIACFSTYSHKAICQTVGPLCLAFSVNTLARVPPAFVTLLSSRWLQWLGVCSYSLYLWQQPFYLAVRYHGADSWLMTVLALLTGVASFYAFENPVRVRLNALWNNRRTALPVAGAEREA